RAAFAAMFAPYQHLDAAKAREAYLRQATLVKRSTTMAYYRANDWAQLATARSERDFVDKKIWLGVVNVTVMLVDPARVAEVEDLTDVPAFEARLNTAFKGMVNGLVQMNKMQIDREVESMLRNANGDPGAVRGAEERKARAAKEHAAAEKATIKVIKREFGANSYVIRMTGISPDTPGLQASVYSGWIRNGNACVRIEFGGNFPEDAMLKEMDHFLSEMDAKTASFGGL
ncbi:MAG TPA: hypothetical protein VK986_15380, partial [Tepidisphaeraceae bacterium]|nr:hypothetical protein [Tepidisphaeraceae bacterium]